MRHRFLIELDVTTTPECPVSVLPMLIKASIHESLPKAGIGWYEQCVHGYFTDLTVEEIVDENSGV
jgi:hypothetical protein